MNIEVANLSSDVANLQISPVERKTESSTVDYGSLEKDRITHRKLSSSSTGSSSNNDRKKILNRKNSEVKIEEIFKQLFSPDAKIVDSDQEFIISLPEPEETEIPDVRKNDKFTVRRQTSLVKKEIAPKKIIKNVPSRKPIKMSKNEKPIERKEKAVTKKLNRNANSLQRPEAVVFDPTESQSIIATEAMKSTLFVRRNAIPLRRAVSMAQKT